MIFSIMCSDTLDVSAAELSSTTSNWSVDISRNILKYSNDNTVIPLDHEKYFLYFGRKSIVNCDTDAYAYKISFNKSGVTASIGPEVYWIRYACGTYNDFIDLSCKFGSKVTDTSTGSETFWIVTDNADVSLGLGIVCYFRETEICNYYGGDPICTPSSSVWPEPCEAHDGIPAYDVDLDVTVTAVPYTRDEYENAMIEQQTITNDKLEEGNILQEEANELQEEANETSKGILGSIQDFFGSFFQNLIDSVISVFVPDSETMKGLFDELNQFFSDTFGFLYYPFEFLIEAFDVFLNSDSSTGLTFPSFSIMGYEVWGNLTYDLTSDELTGDVFAYVRIGTGALLSLAFVNYLRNFFDKRFGGGGS